jgi:hypothetical protein
MNPAQKLYADVKRLLESWGLEEIATDGREHFTQFNVVYVRAGLGRGLALRIAALQGLGRLVDYLLRRRPAPSASRTRPLTSA